MIIIEVYNQGKARFYVHIVRSVLFYCVVSRVYPYPITSPGNHQTHPNARR